MADILKTCPIFKENGNALITTPYGTNIPDYPTKGKIGSHYGLDLVRHIGYSTTATIVALDEGTVTAVCKNVKGVDHTNQTAGNYVKIEHSGGYATRYLHLKYGSIPDGIKVGAKVSKGDVIGYMGNTGNSYGAHLHFEVWKDGVRVNPEPYLMEDLIEESPSAAPTTTYKIVKGDTLSGIGAKFGVPWKEIAELNGIKPPKYTIYAGKEIQIPIITHTVVKGDTLSAIAKKYGSNVDAIVSANKSKYSRITKNHIEVGWVLTIPKEA